MLEGGRLGNGLEKDVSQGPSGRTKGTRTYVMRGARIQRVLRLANARLPYVYERLVQGRDETLRTIGKVLSEVGTI